MEELRKGPRLTTRYSTEQLERLGLAACLASRRRRETVDESTLSREFTDKGSEDMIAAATPEELAQAKKDLEQRRREARRRRGKTRQPAGVQ